MHEWHLFWPAPNRCAVLLVDKPADYARRNTSPSFMAWGRNQTPHPLCGAEAETDPQESVLLWARLERNGAGWLVPGSAWRNAEHTNLNVKCHRSQQHMTSKQAPRERWATMAHLLLHLVKDRKLAGHLTLQGTIVTPCFKNIRGANQFKSFYIL